MDELEINELDSVEGFFDDYEPTSEESVEEPVEEVTEDTPESTDTEDTTGTEEEEQIPLFELKVKYNGEEQTLNEEDARTFAQKGMNYDRIYEPLERLARMNNMSVGDYINQLNDTQFEYEVNNEVDNLRNDPKYEDLNDDILEELARSRVEKNIGQRDRDYADQTQQQADAEQARVQREVDIFLDEYPEFKEKGPDSLDPKVFEFVKQGYTLLEAYNKFQRMNAQNSQAEANKKVSQLNETNKKKSLGSTTNAGSSDSDPFLNGFLNS